MNDFLYRLQRFALLAVFFFAAMGRVLGAEKTEADYITDLDSEEIQLVILACQKLGELKTEKAVDALIDTVTEHDDPRVRIAAASALGQSGMKGRPTDTLKEVVENDDSNDVVYSALLSIGNLKDFDNPNVKASLEYCEENKKDDPFIRDIVVRVRKFVGAK